jgi:uncharacterized protein (TIGR01777 family)
MKRFEVKCVVPVSREALFAYHNGPGALQRLIPPWESVAVESSDYSLEPGSTVVLKMKLGPIALRWVAVHGDFDPPNRFEDRQQSGPFAYWHHRHLFCEGFCDGNVPEKTLEIDSAAFQSSDLAEGKSAESGVSTLIDSIDYQVPLGKIGNFFGGQSVRRQLSAMFKYRHRVTRDDLMLFEKYPSQPLAIAVSGATGLVGTELSGLLNLAGHRVVRLVRDPQEATPGTGPIVDVAPANKGDTHAIAPWALDGQASRLEGVDAVIHLAGKSIADRRWTEEVKREIRDSRVVMTRQLCESIAKLDRPPKTLLCASAIGIYGDRGDEWLDEGATHADDFLGDVATQWEEACRPAIEAGIRVVNLRFGIILSPRGGALQKMLTPVKLGVGGRLGNGKQWWSWIGIDDVIGAIYHCLMTENLNGPVNIVAPNPTTNSEFTKTLGSILHRPTLIPAPATGLRIALGEMADALLLTSTRVNPQVLVETGYQFRHADLRSCLQHLLGR